jgi:uncharacterized protein
MFKESKYNYYTHANDSIIIYNHLSNAIGKLPTSKFENILHDINDKKRIPDEASFTQLANDGFFVNTDYDENAIGELKHLDTISENSLDMTILASEQCNFRCKYCYEDFKRGNITEDVISSFLLFVKRNIYNYRRVNIEWFGGEPLLALSEIEHMSEQLISICRKNGKPYTAGMTTNGYLLTADTLRRAIDCKILTYQITLDGTAEKP